MPEVIVNKAKSEIAFIGTGGIGLNHMKSLLDEDICYPVGIFEPDSRNARKAYDLAPDAIVYGDINDLLEAQPDGIVIAAPNSFHAFHCIKALQRGIAVFCQQPLALTADETRKVISAAYVGNRLLAVDFPYRFTDGMQKIYSLRKDIGQIYAVDLVFNNSGAPEKSWLHDHSLSGGGCLIESGSHLIDLALWMLDFPEITKISSTVMSKGVILEPGRDLIDDYVSVKIETVSGVAVRMVCSWNLSAGQDTDIRASFYGSVGSALFYNVNGLPGEFEAAVCHESKKEIISRSDNEFGTRALIKWTKDLQEDRSFRKSAFLYYNTAEFIDRIYGRIVPGKPLWDKGTDQD